MIQVLNTYSYSGDYLQSQKIYPERGKIYDVNNHLLVTNQTKYLVYAEPKKIEKKNYIVRDLEKVLEIGEATIEAKLDLSKDWVRVKSGVSKDKKDEISKLHINGIGFQEEQYRAYPEASLSAHLLGFVGKNKSGEDIGYFGIEGYYEKELTGLAGMMKSERDLLGRPIFIGTQEKVDPQNGGDLILTIDSAVQTLVKKKLLKGLETYEAKEGCVIVADPNTMKIMSMVCLPDFDPDQYYLFSEDLFKNAAISNLYEPGSTFKPLVVAVAIEEKAIKPDDFMQEDGPITIGEYTIRTWNDKYEGKISMTRVLEKSSNVGMVYIGSKLGNDKLYQYLKKYRFGKETGIDLQGETSGYLKDQKDWYPIDYSTVSFGQGIAVTPIQMIRAFTALINGGNLLKPYVVDKVVTNNNERKQEATVVSKVISDRTSQIIKKMLVSTVENGELKWLKPIGYKIGGKTGTAQIPIKGHYDESKTIASFIGFAPADKPKFIALVIVREPKASQWGSETAAPIFFDIAKELLLYYNIAPDR